MMKRAVLLLVALMLVPGASVQARERNAPARTKVTATILSQATPRRPAQVAIHVESADPDGHITEMAIDFGDGAMVWLLLACDPEEPQGTPAVQDLTWSYPSGEYVVTAWAFSSPDCSSGPFQESRHAVTHLIVS
jgi:hypothetical protein